MCVMFAKVLLLSGAGQKKLWQNLKISGNGVFSVVSIKLNEGKHNCFYI